MKFIPILATVLLLVSCGGNDDSELVISETDYSCLDDKHATNCNQESRAGPQMSSFVSRQLASDPVAYRFDYPIGNRGYNNQGRPAEINEHLQSYNNHRNEEYNLDKNIAADNNRFGTNPGNAWYNANDVGNFYSGLGGKGVHPGEDWNYRVANTTTRGTNSDGSEIAADGAGANVFSIADGVIEDIRTAGPTAGNRGWQIVVRHRLPDNTYVYSVYMHITSEDNDDGAITTMEADFTHQEGDSVSRGDLLGKIAANMTSGLATHLHFEIRDEFTSADALYDNSKENGNGYYTQDGRHQTSMTKPNISVAFAAMREDGIFDPSDFIDDHRYIYPVIGNGSIISYHAKERPLVTLDSQHPFGITQDITESHNIYKQQSGFFQWQASSTCKALRINHPDSNYDADITVGHWSNRVNDITFKDVNLPFVVGQNNAGININDDGQDWYVIAVGLKSDSSNSGISNSQLSATCAYTEPAVYTGSIVSGAPVLIGEHQWNGNASVISRIYSGYSNTANQSLSGGWPFGAFMDVTKIHKSQYKPVVFFQWMTSETCQKLTIDVPELTNKTVQIGTKNWSGSQYSYYSTTLPADVSSRGLWTVIKVAFYEPVDKTYTVQAVCK